MQTKTLDSANTAEAKASVSDIKVVGDCDIWKLLCKASSAQQGWMKSTKAMQIQGGCLVQVTTQQKNPDGSYSTAESVCFAPGAKIVDGINGGKALE